MKLRRKQVVQTAPVVATMGADLRAIAAAQRQAVRQQSKAMRPQKGRRMITAKTPRLK